MAGKDQGKACFLEAFVDPKQVERYAEGIRRFMPGLDALHRMVGILLAEHAPADARVLVLGAGGGVELKALADMHPGWSFIGVDPAAEMLRMAERTLGPQAQRAQLLEGYIDDAPAGPYDAAVCLLTLHFLDAAERARTVRAIHARLKPGAAFVAAHGSFPQAGTQRAAWIGRYAAYALASGAEVQAVETASASVAANSDLFSPEQDEAILRDGGFKDVTLFYAAFTWRGWVGHA